MVWTKKRNLGRTVFDKRKDKDGLPDPSFLQEVARSDHMYDV